MGVINIPYHIEKSGNGYVVVSTDTGKHHSGHPLTKGVAERQMAALNIAMKREEHRTKPKQPPIVKK